MIDQELQKIAEELNVRIYSGLSSADLIEGSNILNPFIIEALKQLRDAQEKELKNLLKGHSTSELWGDDGLIAATLRKCNAYDIQEDKLEIAMGGLREIMDEIAKGDYDEAFHIARMIVEPTKK